MASRTRAKSGLTKKQQLTILRWITHIGALIPLVWLYVDYYTYNLGANEIRTAILRTGKPALVLLILSLAVTPVSMVTGWKVLLPLRKPLGLYAFMYVCIHLLIFVGIDYLFIVGEAFREMVIRQYALVGLAAFLILLPLALTSTAWSQRKLGRNWKKLHRLVYLAAILAVIHFLWLVKQDYGEPIFYGSLLGLLLLMRIKPIKGRITSWRKGIQSRRRKALAAQKVNSS